MNTIYAILFFHNAFERIRLKFAYSQILLRIWITILYYYYSESYFIWSMVSHEGILYENERRGMMEDAQCQNMHGIIIMIDSGVKSVGCG